MAEFTLGARASCPDGFCGVVSRTILDPAARTVTHLVIGPRHGGGGRLVPLDLAEETELVNGGYGGYGDIGGMGMRPARRSRH
jgi:hypothetical protein